MRYMDEIELINRCIQKDHFAWNEFVKRYSGLVYWAVENRLKKWDYFYHPEDIEEIFQNVFLALWKKNKLEQIKDQQKISSWLIIVAGNEAVNYFRFQKSQTPPNAISIFEEIIQKGKAVTIADALPLAARNPIFENELDDILEQEINSLAPNEKIILKLHILYNKKYREIAEMVNMPLGSICTSLKNIKRKLKSQLKKKLPACW